MRRIVRRLGRVLARLRTEPEPEWVRIVRAKAGL